MAVLWRAIGDFWKVPVFLPYLYSFEYASGVSKRCNVAAASLTFFALRLCLTSRISSQQFLEQATAVKFSSQAGHATGSTGTGPVTDASTGQKQFHRGALGRA